MSGNSHPKANVEDRLDKILHQLWVDAGDYWTDSDVSGPMPAEIAIETATQSIKSLIQEQVVAELNRLKGISKVLWDKETLDGYVDDRIKTLSDTPKNSNDKKRSA